MQHRRSTVWSVWSVCSLMPVIDLTTGFHVRSGCGPSQQQSCSSLQQRAACSWSRKSSEVGVQTRCLCERGNAKDCSMRVQCCACRIYHSKKKSIDDPALTCPIARLAPVHRCREMHIHIAYFPEVSQNRRARPKVEDARMAMMGNCRRPVVMCHASDRAWVWLATGMALQMVFQ